MEKNSRRTVLLPISIAVSIVIGIFIGMFVARNNPDKQMASLAREINNGANKLTQTLAYINKLYVDPVSMDSIVEALMPDLMSGLDPHSVYIAAKDMQRTNEALDGEFDGIGVVFNMATDTVIVLNVVTNGPSYKAGVQNGVRIIKINDSIVASHEIPQDDIVKMLRGKSGTQAKLEFERRGLPTPMPLTITRD